MFSRIQELCAKHGTTITALCKGITGSSGNLPTWKKDNIRNDYLLKIAEYFNVSTDYLLGKTENPTTTNDSEVKDLQDPVTAEILDIISKLSPEGQDWAISQLRSFVELEAKKGK